MKEKKAQEFSVEIQKTQNKLYEIAGNKDVMPFFRFPTGYGANMAEGKKIIEQLGFANFYWSMSAHDSRTKDYKEALATSTQMLNEYKKGIFLCHDIRPHTVKMLPLFIDELIRRQFKNIQFRIEEVQ